MPGFSPQQVFAFGVHHPADGREGIGRSGGCAFQLDLGENVEIHRFLVPIHIGQTRVVIGIVERQVTPQQGGMRGERRLVWHPFAADKGQGHPGHPFVELEHYRIVEVRFLRRQFLEERINRIPERDHVRCQRRSTARIDSMVLPQIVAEIAAAFGQSGGIEQDGLGFSGDQPCAVMHVETFIPHLPDSLPHFVVRQVVVLEFGAGFLRERPDGMVIVRKVFGNRRHLRTENRVDTSYLIAHLPRYFKQLTGILGL